MNNPVSNCHEGDLGGRFLPFADTKRVGITVAVSPEAAGLPSVQHTAWMLVNILARCLGVVQRLSLQCPHGIQIAKNVVPLAAGERDLRAALIRGVTAIGILPLEEDVTLERVLVVGSSETSIGGHMFVAGGGWSGGIAQNPIHLPVELSHSPLPFGPYIASCLAAGEIFKAARMPAEMYKAPAEVFYSAWDHKVSQSLQEHPTKSDGVGPSEIQLQLDAAIVGVGAVGCAAIHTLWACPGLHGKVSMLDNDPKGLEATNLNRYTLFGTSSVGGQKASSAAKLVAGSPIEWVAEDIGVETSGLDAPRVVSAVDRNTARLAIQSRYPARLFSASTHDLRTEILRCGPPGTGACLRCYNEPEKITPDEEVRAKLRAASDEKVQSWADSCGVSLHEAREWASTGQCGLAGEQLLKVMRVEEGEPAFAVAFVSVLAGVLAAAELIKDDIESTGPLSAALPRMVFQFFSPLARSNRPNAYARDPNCPTCDPTHPAAGKWLQRYEGLLPRKDQRASSPLPDS